jgi:palmitoyl-protein thioesterase
LASFLSFSVSAHPISAQQLEIAVENTREIWAPEIQLVSEPAINATDVGKTYRPTVIAHGMGDSGKNKGMMSLCQTVRDKYPGSFVLCSTTADSGKSITMTFIEQLAAFREEIASHPELANGFNAVGLSQGNYLIESYVALVNDPPVYNFASICGPLYGIGTCPKNIAFDAVCPVWKLDPYGAPLAFSSYWKGTMDKDKYLEKSVLLADVLNEKQQKNATVKANWLKLNQLLMIEADKDTMLVPRNTELGGMWAWGSQGNKAPIVTLQASEGYQGDWIGLKTLDQLGKLRNSTFEGEHIRFTSEYWDANILPLLGNTF